MIKKNNKNTEFNHFSELSNEWWKPEGKFKILHTLTPVRMKYIKSVLPKIIKKNNKLNNPIYNLDVLDLGCGGGLICEPLSRLGANVTGVDFILENINVAKKHSKESNLNIKYFTKDLNKIKLNKKYDLILILEVLEHLENWEEIISKIKKNLKPKGRIIISTIDRNLLSYALAIFFAENILKWVPKKTHNFKNLIKPQELINCLKKNNFKVIDITGLVFKPFLLEWHLSKKMNKINYFCTAIKTN